MSRAVASTVSASPLGPGGRPTAMANAPAPRARYAAALAALATRRNTVAVGPDAVIAHIACHSASEANPAPTSNTSTWPNG